MDANQRALSGLYLIQFEGPIRAAWRDELTKSNVRLVEPVPDDAFIAQLNQSPASLVKSLPFVRWIGPYLPADKVDARLGKARLAPVLKIKLLLVPGLSPLELGRLRRLMSSFFPGVATAGGRIATAQVTPAQLLALSQSSVVLWIESAPRTKLFDEVAAKITEGGVLGQTNQHATTSQQLGFDGKGVTVAVADSGLNFGTLNQMHPDLSNRVDAFFFYGSVADASDAHGHGTHVTGIIAGNGATGETDEQGALYGLGMAPQAHIVAQRIFDGAGGFEPPPSMEILTRDAVRAGAVIGSNSWGDDTNGRYDLSAAEFDALVRDADAETPGDQPYVLEFSAGNAGPGEETIGSPAVAKNVIATGASQNDRFGFFIYDQGREAMADFSSRGPCEDGRIKPDLVAPGTWIASLQSYAATDQNAWLPISPNYQFEGGTSQAGPQVSGAAAVFVQYYRETHNRTTPSPALVKAALINAAELLAIDTGNRPVPNQVEGWGRVDLVSLVSGTRKFDFLDQSVLLATGQIFEKPVVVANSDEMLKVTMAYTDVPGFPGAIPALVNDLDLEVVGPNGELYRGNQFLEGESVPGTSERDALNNVEAVHLSHPAAGNYLVRVRARNVPQDARKDTAAIDQDFALVVSGSLPAPGEGVVILDRPAYSAPGLIQVKLIDFDLTNQSSVSVLARSSTDPAGIPVSLKPTAVSTVFTGAVATATSPTPLRDHLQIQHGDSIEVIYQDDSPPGIREAQARADLVPPVITDVGATNRFGQTVVVFRTDEPAQGLILFGTNGVLSAHANENTFATDHQIALGALQARRIYQFAVASMDAAGNWSTNNNNGQFFKVTPQPAATVLLVNDFNDPILENPLSNFTNPLNQTKVSYAIWQTADQGAPTASDLKPFPVVIWRVAEFNDTPLTAADQSAIRSYLDGGGSIFIASEELLSRLDAGGFGSFRTNVLHVTSYQADAGVAAVTGVASDPITSGMQLTLDYSSYPDLGVAPQDLSDTFGPATNAAPVFRETSGGQAAGLRFPKTGQDSRGRVVFFSFPFDAIPETGDAPNNRRNVLLNVLKFLAPGVNGLSSIALDNSVYTIPSLVTVEVADRDLIGQNETTVRFASLTATNRLPVRLNETVRPGVFRGFVTLVSATNRLGPGQLPAREGDLITAEYFDASSQSLVRTFASVDVTPPSISQVTVTPGFEEALVEWQTSEPSDSLVQFGESSFLGRTAYSPELTEEHALNLVGLLPDRQYYFKVVSRDAAGNAGEKDNGGTLFAFRTAKPIAAPWRDDFEHGATNWVALNQKVDGLTNSSVTAWQLGQPQNGRETNAVSGTHAWGTNLKGAVVEYGSTDLISPAIDLSGGNQATLHFWHSYDFSQRSQMFDIEVGQLAVSTNNGNAWITIADYSDKNSGWEQAEVDLTPYLGKVVRLDWHYELFTFDALPRPGWLIDDVSVVVTNQMRGVVLVTNNLSQAHFTVSGPISKKAAGLSLVLSNAPLGQYVVQFDPVPFYHAPAPLTNSLSGRGTLMFRGQYWFTDSNHNGISDDWEQKYFGVVSSTRTAQTDSDGDGMTDLQEFLAGTDPTRADSVLRLSLPELLPNGTLRFKWNSVPERSYRLLGSTNIVPWMQFSNWQRAAGTNMSYVLPALNQGHSYFFKLEVSP